MSKSTQENTKRKKQAFIDNYIMEDCGMITEACRRTGMAPRTYYSWLEKDEAFNTQMQAIKKEIQAREAEFYEGTIKDVVSNAKTPAQSRLLGSFFMLKGLKPDVYREKQSMPTIIGDVTIKWAIPPYDTPKLTDGNIIEGEAKEL